MTVGSVSFRPDGSRGQNRRMQLRERRLGRGWSQEQLAELTGLSVRTIQRIENGQTPGLASTTALAAAFGMPVDQLVDLLGGNDDPVPPPMSFPAAIRGCLVRYAEFDGVAGRAEYWWFMLFVVLAGSVGVLVDEVVGAVVLLVLLVPLVAAGTRRLRDSGQSGWWQLLGLVPFGGVVPLFLLARPSAASDA